MTYDYFKPYLTWAAYGRMDGPENHREVEDTHIFYRYHPPAFTRILTKDIEAPELYYIELPPSVYGKTEYRKEQWIKFGTDYDDDPVFMKAQHSPDKDNGGQLAYYTKKSPEEHQL